MAIIFTHQSDAHRRRRKRKTGNDDKMTIAQQLDFIADKFSSVDSLPLNVAEAALRLLDKAPKEALQLIVDRKVKFLWIPANRRLKAMSN